LGVDVAKNLTVMGMESNFMMYWYRKDDIFTSREYRLLVNKRRAGGQGNSRVEENQHVKRCARKS
jgi:hypothetical protein